MADEIQQNLLLSKEHKEQLVAALRNKGVPRACPMCAHPSWTIADGYFNQTMQSDFRGMVIGGPSIPSIAIICESCGFISQHALGMLGLLPQTSSEGDKK